MRTVALIAVLAAALGAQTALSRADAYRRARDLAVFGRALFFDETLSASGKMSCATCHDPRFAYGPPDALATPAGGFRAVPSLRYLQAAPAFTEHYYADESAAADSIDAGPTGGLTWDGRVNRAREQARLPLLSPFEMANRTPADVVARVRLRPYSAPLHALNSETAFEKILEALEVFQQTPEEFYPYTSKYDAVLAGTASFTAAEHRGIALFSNPARGNCAGCHPSARGPNGEAPQFTDYGYAALGVPRNPGITANANATWFDLGLCGPERTDLRSHTEYCGLFYTPTLRNVALRSVFFHNGAVHALRDAVAFYATRDSDPAHWYPHAKFDDLPTAYRGNVEAAEPFGHRERALSDEDVDDLVAFLKTLTDGWK